MPTQPIDTSLPIENNNNSASDKNASNMRSDIIDPKLFSLPTENEYYRNAVDIDWFVKIMNAYNARSPEDRKTDTQKLKDAVFYTEDPPFTDPGYYESSAVYVLKPSVSDLRSYCRNTQLAMGTVDGDTILFSPDSTKCGDMDTKNFLSSLTDTWFKKMSPYLLDTTSSHYNTLAVRILAIQCPEVPHYSIISEDRLNQAGLLNKKSARIGDIANDTDVSYVLYEKSGNGYEPRSNEESIDLVYIQNRWREVLSAGDVSRLRGDDIGVSGLTPHVYVSSDHTDKRTLADGYAAGRLMKKLIDDALDARLVVNATTQSRRADKDYPSLSSALGYAAGDSAVLSKLAELVTPDVLFDHSLFRETGFNKVGQDLYGRILAALYVQVPYGENNAPIWVNAAKYILAQNENTKINNSINRSVINGKFNNYLSPALKPETYEYNEKLWSDEVWSALSEKDTRFKIQQATFALHKNGFKNDIRLSSDMDDLKDWTVLLGDMAFMVPPTGIRVLSQTTTEKIPAVRARGSIQRGVPRYDRMIEMELYFNELDGINGVPVEWKLPGDTPDRPITTTYWMNGLRALEAHFRLVPFLPIENEYINTVIGISAVTFSQLEFETVPGFPRLIKANLVLREFDVSAYMPQIPRMENEIASEGYRNYFAKLINYDTLRFYYQRQLQLGNRLATADVASRDYMRETIFANRTALCPYEVTDNLTMSFYAPNEELLMWMLALKMQVSTKKAGDNFNPTTPVMKRYMERMVPLASALYEVSQDKSIYGAFDSNPNHDNYTTLEGYRVVAERTATIIRERGGNIVGDVSAHGNGNYWYVTIKLNVSDIVTDEAQIKTLKDEAGSRFKAPGSELAKDEIIEIKIIDDGGKIVPDLNSWDIAFVAWCAQNAGTESGDDQARALKSAIDIEQIESMRFDKILDNVRISSMSVVMKNTFTDVSLQNSGLTASQFLGGTDIVLTGTLQTTDKEVASVLQALPKLQAYLHRQYHLVLPMTPFKISSAFTKLAGVTEVSIDSMVVNTTPNFPGVYSIQFQMTSVDRTLRNREALRKLDLPDNEHLTSNGKKAEEKSKSYFQLEDTIKAVNLYPDLELPTIQELSEYGFQFIRYKNRTQVYPDPDFYILYPGVIMNEGVRSAVFRYLKGADEEWAQRTYKDASGAELSLSPFGKIDYSKSNDVFKKQLELYKRDEENRRARESNLVQEKFKAFQHVILGDLGAWDISKQIKACFMESYYYKRLLKYIENTDEQVNTKSDTDIVNEAATDNQTPTGTDTDGKLVYTKIHTDAAETAKKHLWDSLWTKPSDSESAKDYIYKMIAFIRSYDQSSTGEAAVPRAEVGTGNGMSVKSLAVNMATDVNKLIVACLSARAGRGLYDASYSDIFTTNRLGNYADYNDAISDFLGTDKFIPNWLPDPDIVGIVGRDTDTDQSTPLYIHRDNVAEFSDGRRSLRNISEAGYFRIKFYTLEELEEVIAPKSLDRDELKKSGKDRLYGQRVYCLDPAYWYSSAETIDELKNLLITEPAFSGIMFIREMAYWLLRLYDWFVFPNFCLDVARLDSMNEQKVLRDLDSEMKKQARARDDARNGINDGDTKFNDNSAELTEFQKKTASAVSKFMRNNSGAIDMGKLFAAASLAITNGDKGLIRCMIQRDYRALNGYISSTFAPVSDLDATNNARGILRKFTAALVAEGLIDDTKSIGYSDQSPQQKWLYGYNQRKVLSAANDPSQWLFHSFYDMIQSDYRGRLCRAFPAFYMVLVDEGRDLGFWKLHDNFYNTNAIASLKIMKSRMIPADTAYVELSNMFRTFTDIDEDGKDNYKYTLRDTFKSIFSPYTYAKEEEMKRKLTPEINRAKLRPGTRIHIRLGYGNDASLLPVTFNGVIAEIEEGEVVRFTAQGDGIELVNKIPDVDADDTISDLMYRERPFGNSWFQNTYGFTPRSIMAKLLTERGTWLAKKFEDSEMLSRLFDENPYGLFHYGAMEYKDIFPEGEPVQNLYEVDKNPSIGYLRAVADLSEITGDKDDRDAQNEAQMNTESMLTANERETCEANKIPMISFNVAGKSLWNILKICVSTDPGFIGTSVDFGFRSSIFMGRPKYYYAYGYKNTDGNVVERRKPFQQYHLYFEESDIISNGITARRDAFRTVITGSYKRKALGCTTNCHVGPIYADFDLYPENQRGILFDTQYVAENPNAEDMPNFQYKAIAEEGRTIDGEEVGSLPLFDSVPILNRLYDFGLSFWELGKDKLYPDAAKNDEIARIARNMCLHELSDSVKRMYDGQLIVVGDPSVKPYDALYLADSFRNMSGVAEVRDVTHTFSVNDGFITAITPDCVNTADDRDKMIVQASLTHTALLAAAAIPTGILATTLGGYFTRRGLGIINRGVSVASSMYGRAVSSKWIQKGTGFVSDKARVLGATDKAKSLLTYVRESKAASALSKASSGMSTLLKSPVGRVVGGVVSRIALPAAIVYGIGSFASDLLGNKIKNLRALRIYPLVVNGLPYTAGLEGEKSLVAGSPNDGQEGIIGSLIGEWLAPAKGNSMGDEIGNIVKQLFLDQDAMDAAAKFSHEAGLTDVDGNATMTEQMMIDVLSGANENAAVHYKGSTGMLAQLPLCGFTKAKEVTRSVEQFKVSTIKNLSMSPNLKQAVYIPQAPGLSGFYESRFLRLAHEGSELSDASRMKYMCVELADGTVKEINGIVYDTGVIDLPFLNTNAIVVLNDIVKISFDAVRRTVPNEADIEAAKNEMGGHYIVVKKALQAGSARNEYDPSGFSFIIQGYGPILKDSLYDIVSELSKRYPEVFQCVKNAANEIAILVAVPKR